MCERWKKPREIEKCVYERKRKRERGGGGGGMGWG